MKLDSQSFSYQLLRKAETRRSRRSRVRVDSRWLHLLRRAAGFISQAALPGFGWIFFKLNHFVSICHLQNGEVFHVPTAVVLTASEDTCRSEASPVRIRSRLYSSLKRRILSKPRPELEG